MPERFNRDAIDSTLNHLFNIAKDKMESDHDKEVLGGLK